MYIFLTGRPPFETDNITKTYERIKIADYKIPSSLSNQGAIDLLRKILVVDPAKRFTFDQIL
jgi:serine/threonine protein kinase